MTVVSREEGLHNVCWHPLSNNRFFLPTWRVPTVPASCHCCATVTTRDAHWTGSKRPSIEYFAAIAKLLSYRTIKTCELESYPFSIFQPVDAWFRFATGYAGHSVLAAEVFLCAADVLYPLRKSCKWGKLKSCRVWEKKSEKNTKLLNNIWYGVILKH